MLAQRLTHDLDHARAESPYGDMNSSFRYHQIMPPATMAATLHIANRLDLVASVRCAGTEVMILPSSALRITTIGCGGVTAGMPDCPQAAKST
jgi:hypothetical protein